MLPLDLWLRIRSRANRRIYAPWAGLKTAAGKWTWRLDA